MCLSVDRHLLCVTAAVAYLQTLFPLWFGRFYQPQRLLRLHRQLQSFLERHSVRKKSVAWTAQRSVCLADCVSVSLCISLCLSVSLSVDLPACACLSFS